MPHVIQSLGRLKKLAQSAPKLAGERFSIRQGHGHAPVSSDQSPRGTVVHHDARQARGHRLHHDTGAKLSNRRKHKDIGLAKQLCDFVLRLPAYELDAVLEPMLCDDGLKARPFGTVTHHDESMLPEIRPLDEGANGDLEQLARH